MFIVFDNKKAVTVTSTTELSYAIKTNTQTTELAVVTPEQSKFIELVVSAILSMIQEGNRSLTLSLNGFIHRNKLGKQSVFLRFLTKIEDQTPIQTPMFIEFYELNEIEKEI